MLSGIRVQTKEMELKGIKFGYTGNIFSDGTCQVYYYENGKKIIQQKVFQKDLKIIDKTY